MTHELLKRLSALRGINPRLNSVTDQVTEIVRSVEKTLVDELKIGVDASVWFMSEPGGEPGVTREHHLAFSRVGSTGYRINVCIVTDRQNPESSAEAATSTRLNEERILWSSCSRELKLKASEKLPALLDNIIKNAESLLKTANDTAATIKEMLGGDNQSAPPPPEEPGKRGRFERSRRRAYSVEDAIRAHRHYFLDNLGVSETALNSLLSDGWVESGPRKFACRDHSGSERCSVAFVDDEGSAEVNFPDGESRCVSIDARVTRTSNTGGSSPSSVRNRLLHMALRRSDAPAPANRRGLFGIPLDASSYWRPIPAPAAKTIQFGLFIAGDPFRLRT